MQIVLLYLIGLSILLSLVSIIITVVYIIVSKIKTKSMIRKYIIFHRTKWIEKGLGDKNINGDFGSFLREYNKEELKNSKNIR